MGSEHVIERPDGNARSVSLWLSGVMALAVLALQVVPVLAPAIAAAADLSPAFVGAWSAGLWTAALVGTLLAPPLLARHPAWRLSQWCLLLCAAGIACAATGHVVGLVLAAMLIGLAQGIEGPMASHLLAAHVPPTRRALWFSVKQTGVQVAAVVASLLLPVVAVAAGWRSAALAALALTLAYTLMLQRPGRQHVTPRPAAVPGRGFGVLSALAALQRQPVLRWLALTAAAFGSMQVALNGFFVTYAVTERGVTLVQAGAWLSAAQVGGLVGRVGWGWVASRLGTITPLLLALGLVMGGCTVAMGWLGPSWPLMLVFGLSASGWNGIFLAEVAHHVPAADAGTATAAVLVLMMLGLIGGPLLFSALSAGTSFGSAYMGWALVALLGCAALLRARSFSTGT